jgi:three-Cys-motif partner protein
MPAPPLYRNREQTYLKHLFLEKYLEKFTIKLGFSVPEIWYIDGFSGPWESQDPTCSDTSFAIAHRTMTKALNVLMEKGKNPVVRCLFIEKDRRAYERLALAVSRLGNNSKIKIDISNGDFESKINDFIAKLNPRAFVFYFIDPTGWTGFNMNKMRPILKPRGSEVLINFMFDFINRFIDPQTIDLEESFNQLFGNDSWKKAIRQEMSGEERETAIINHYCDCLKKSGNFRHVTYTRVFYPDQERTYFYLILGTHDTEGIRVFRKVEEQFAREQENIRDEKINPATLFPLGTSFHSIREKHIEDGKTILIELLQQRGMVDYKEVESRLLELQYIGENVLQKMLRDLKDCRQITVPEWQQRERKFKGGHTLVWVENRQKYVD